MLMLGLAVAVILSADSVRTVEPAPHDGVGNTTVWRYSDKVPGRTMEFRRRQFAPGGSIGLHPLAHDEVYYILAGQGVVTSDGVDTPVGAGSAAYLYTGSTVGIRGTGATPLDIIVSYPVVVPKR